jgi:hypothetical protein
VKKPIIIAISCLPIIAWKGGNILQNYLHSNKAGLSAEEQAISASRILII